MGKLLSARFKGSLFARNLLTVMAGTAAAQAVGFALSPVISRLFTPADFGVFGSFTAVLAVISAGVTLEYSQAIMLPKGKEDAMNLLVVSCLAATSIAGICLIGCLLVPSVFQGLINSPNAWLLMMLVLGVFLAGINQAFQAWCVRVKAFRQTSASQVVRSLSANGLQIGSGLAKYGGSGLVVGGVLADFFASLNLAWVVRADWTALRSAISWPRMKQLAVEYRDFPLYSATQNLINALSSGLPVFLLTHFYGLAVAGAYAFGMRMLQVPMNLVSRALRQVLFQRACETQHEGAALLPLYRKATFGLLALGLLPAVALMIVAPQLFAWAFGAKWGAAGEFARYLILWLLVAFCNLPAVIFARLIRIQRTVFFFDLFMLAFRTAALVVGGIYGTALQSVLLFSVVGVVMNVVLIVLVDRAVQRTEFHSPAATVLPLEQGRDEI